MNRATVVVLALCVLAIVVGVYLLFYTPANAPIEEHAKATLTAGPIPFTVLASGNSAVNAPKRKNYRIVSNEDLAAVWTAVYGKNASAPPSIDFSKQEVLAILDGEHPTGGYAVSVKVIEDADAARTVAIAHAEPDSSCVVMEAKTSPFLFVVVPSQPHDMITHTDETATVACK